MKVKDVCATVLVMTGVVFSANTFAQNAPPPTTATTPPPLEPAATAAVSAGLAKESKMRLGINLVPSPYGSYTVGAGGASTSETTAFAFGVMPVFDYLVHPNFFVGVGPTYTFNVKAKDAGGDASKELDLLLRLGGGMPVNEKLGVFGYLSPGYSIIQLPSGAVGDNPKGFALGVHAGAMFSLTPTMFLNGQLGYQLGMQKTTVAGVDVDANINLLQIGLGAGVRL